MNKLTEDEGQVQPRGQGTSIEDVAQTYSFFSVIKKNLDINRFLCAIKIKEKDLLMHKILCNAEHKQKKWNKNNWFIELSNIHGAYNISKDIQENNENSQKAVILIFKLT